jgi:hypothetical protein
MCAQIYVHFDRYISMNAGIPANLFTKLMGLRKTPPKGKAKGLSALAGRIILLRYERFVIASARRRHLASADSVA